jgi:hypothetical protein
VLLDVFGESNSKLGPADGVLEPVLDGDRFESVGEVS